MEKRGRGGSEMGKEKTKSIEGKRDERNKDMKVIREVSEEKRERREGQE